MKNYLNFTKETFLYILGVVLFLSACKKMSTDELSTEVSIIKKDSVPPIFKDTLGLFRKSSNSTNTHLANARQIISSSFDYSGRVEVAIWAEYIDGAHNHVEVSVDPGFVLIGGGARASNFNNTNVGVNALLTAAYPKDDGTFSTFVADSKDHSVSYSHRLWVYAIGMRLYDIQGQPLSTYSVQAAMSLTKTVSTSAAHPSVSACPPTGYTVLSGGARVNYGAGAGNLLTETMLNASGCWAASSKDHGISSWASIESYVLSIDASNQSLAQFGVLEISTRFGIHSSSSNSTSTVDLQVYPDFYNWVMAGVGGRSVYNGNGRLLYEVYPINTTSGRITDKDHIYPDTGTLYGYITMIRKQ